MNTQKQTSSDINLTKLEQIGYTEDDIRDIIASRRLLKEKTWSEVCVPPRFKNATFDSFRVDPENRSAFNRLVQAAKSYSGDWVYIVGPTGVGKTHLAYAVAKELANQGYWPRFIKWTEAVRDMIAAIKGEDYSRYADDYRGKRPLILDDFGSTDVGGYLVDGVRDRTLEIIDYRYDHELPLIVTTNLVPAEIEKKYGSRVRSRLLSGVNLSINGKDRRNS